MMDSTCATRLSDALEAIRDLKDAPQLTGLDFRALEKAEHALYLVQGIEEKLTLG